MASNGILSGIGLFTIILTLLIPNLSSEQQAQTNTSAPASNFKTYSNPTFGIKMQYPSDWVKLDLSGNNSSSLLVAFGSPIGGPVGSLNIIAEKGSVKNLTFSEFVAANINNLKKSGKILNLTSSTPSSLAGNPAHRIEYTTTSSRGIPFKTMQIFSLTGNKAYFVTYAAPSENYAIHFPTIQTMINTLTISK